MFEDEGLRTFELSNLRTFEPSNLRTFEPSNLRTFRTFEPSNPRTLEPSTLVVVQRERDMPDRRPFGKWRSGGSCRNGWEVSTLRRSDDQILPASGFVHDRHPARRPCERARPEDLARVLVVRAQLAIA